MKVVIISSVQHDATLLVEGDTPDLPQAMAEALIAAGAAIATGRKPKADKAPGADAEAEAAAAAAAAAAAGGTPPVV